MTKEKDIKVEAPEIETPVVEEPAAEKVEGKKKKCSKKEDPLKKQVEELTDKLSQEKESYFRLMAEFETFRRRSAEDRLSLIASASADTIKGLLPVLDDCERAIQLIGQSSDAAAKEGIELIYNKLMEYLKTKGLQKIEAKGEAFDTDFHEAVTQFPVADEDMKGKVIEVVQTGYLYGGKVLRFAKVVVGA